MPERLRMLVVLSCLVLPAVEAAVPTLEIGPVAVSQRDDPAFAAPDFDDTAWERRAWQTLQFQDVIWLRARVRVPADLSGSPEPVALRLTAAAAAEIWWDGHLLGRNGRPAASPDDEVPGRLDAVFLLQPAQLTPGEHVLALRLSRQHGSGRIWTPVDRLNIGIYDAAHGSGWGPYLPGLASAGAVSLAAVFLFGMAWRGRDPAAAWLAAACVALVAQFGIEAVRAFINYSYDWHGPRLTGIAVAAWLVGFCTLAFLTARFHTPKAWRWRATAGALALSAFALYGFGDLVTAVVLLVFLLGAGAVALDAVRRHQPGAWTAVAILAAMLVVLVLQTMPFLDRWLYVGFAVMLVLFFASHVRSYVQALRDRDAAEHSAARLELELLKQHLRPHVLMNALSALAEWVESDPRTGVRMVHALADEFRSLNEIADRELIPLSEELALCRAHLEVMSFRRDHAYGLAVSGEDAGVMLPPATLHTLVENAVTHGDGRGGDGNGRSVFDLSVEQCGRDRWCLRLRCPPAGDRSGTVHREGTGLSYVRARLTEAFGDEASLVHGLDEAGGWTTEIEMPARSSACGS